MSQQKAPSFARARDEQNPNGQGSGDRRKKEKNKNALLSNAIEIAVDICGGDMQRLRKMALFGWK